MVVGLLILVVLAVLAAALVLPRLIAAQLATLRDDTARQLNERNADVDRRLADVTETIDRRLASSNQAATKIHERLGEVTKATAEMNERAKVPRATSQVQMWLLIARQWAKRDNVPTGIRLNSGNLYPNPATPNVNFVRWAACVG